MPALNQFTGPSMQTQGRPPDQDIEQQNFSRDYRHLYPEGVNLKPGTEQHNALLAEVLSRAVESQQKMGQRFPVWDEIDDMLNVFIPLSEKERLVKKADVRKPVSIVVPELFAVLETILTYMTNVFGGPEVFRYTGQGPEDTLGAILLEKAVEVQTTKDKALLAMTTNWRDGFAYGVGIMALDWDVEMGKRTILEDVGFFLPPIPGEDQAEFVKTGEEKTVIDTVLFEGSRAMSIDPRKYLPDPLVPIYEVQKGEYVGWKTTTNYMQLRQREASPGSVFFNAKYLRGREGRSIIYPTEELSREPANVAPNISTENVQPIDLVFMYIDLMPKEWGLGASDIPEKWLIVVANDTAIVAMHPMDLHHNMFPVSVCAPDFSGHESMPISRLEMIMGLQVASNFRFNSRMANVRKSLNNQLIVNPRMLNMNDVESSSAGKLIRMRLNTWNAKPSDSYAQLKVEDMTAGHMSDMILSRNTMQEISGAVDSVRGVQRTSGERVTAEEFSATRNAALSRLQKAAQIISMQQMTDLATMYAYHTQQFMTQEMYVKIIGRTESELRTEHQITDSRMLITPESLSIAFDIKPHDGSMQGETQAQSWLQLWEMAVAHPEVSATLNIPLIFMHIARLLGADNAHDFLRMPEVNSQITPAGQVQDQLQQGNIVRLQQGVA